MSAFLLLASSEGLLYLTEYGYLNYWKAPIEIDSETPGHNLLSRRERDVAKMVMEGLKSKEIGDELFISVDTVKSHLANAYRKVGVGGRAAFVSHLLRCKICQEGEEGDEQELSGLHGP